MHPYTQSAHYVLCTFGTITNAEVFVGFLFSLVPRPSHRPAFDRLQYAKTGEGRPGLFYHMDISVYLSRQRGMGGTRLKETSLMPFLVVSSPSAVVQAFVK